jgi:methyl-accepting chemotaxis protein
MSWTISENAQGYADADLVQHFCERRRAVERRRSSIIDPKLQYSLVKSFLLVFVVASGIYYVATTFAFLQVYAILDAVSGPERADVLARVEQLEHLLAWGFGCTLCAFAAFIWRAGLRLSHRIAGPIFALTRHLNRVADGRTDADLQLREDDYFAALQEAFNRHMDAYRQRAAKAVSSTDA